MFDQTYSWKFLPGEAQAFIALVITAGIAALGYAAAHPASYNLAEYLCYLGIAVLASRLKIYMPGVPSTLSVNFLLVLVGILELSFPETLTLACIAMVAQSFFPERPGGLQVAFNVCTGAVAATLSYWIYHNPLCLRYVDRPFLLGLAACVYFIAYSGPAAALSSLTERKPLFKILVTGYAWSFPYYLVGAAVAGAISWTTRAFNWETSLLLLPVAYLIYRSYHLYLGKLDDEKRHVEEMASLHLRTIEALALAIEAKDQNTHDHLQRVRVYAVEVAKEMGVTGPELEALHAAALLHDIGKLAVPEHIISKPGRLTPEEFEKMKIHTLVGAEILERVRFPYPVVPIVRAHHEKWDGSGYPFGLKGTQIPLGARILSAVDYIDALASDRQYRRALPMEQVMQQLSEQSAKSFDPAVVRVLEKNHSRFEKAALAKSAEDGNFLLTTNLKIEHGPEPEAGFENTSSQESAISETRFLTSIAGARQEAQSLFELAQDLGASLSLGETLSVFSVKLRPLVPYDSIAIYILRNDELVPEYVSGENYRLFSSLRIPLGEGLSGWVAQNKKPIVNGNPAVEPGYLNDASKYTSLRSALAVPLQGISGVIGVLALYRTEPDGFTSDHLRILLAVCGKMALAIENALKYEQAESSATTDYLTGLPNARSLFLQLDRELARCKRDNTTLTVMISDLDGFKQVNDAFGHLEGNRVLRLFAHALKESCREYDYVARMGGDEFVIIAPGLPAAAAAKRVEQLQALAHQAGIEVCREDLLSLSVGCAVYPADGENAEMILAQADRCMYLQKQKQPDRKNRRSHARTKCRVMVELLPLSETNPVFGNLVNMSLGGCFVETGAVLAPGTGLKVAFSSQDRDLDVQGTVTRIVHGSGLAVQFIEVSRDARDKMYRVLEFVQRSSAFYDNRYAENFSKK